MEVRNGYKKTEVGIIPEDWDVKRLGEIGEAIIGLTYKPTDVRSDGILVLRSSNVKDGALRFEDNVFVETEIPEKLMVKSGDILICVRNGSRELIGKCAKLDERAKGMTFGAFMTVFRSPFNNFVSHQFQSRIIKKQINEHLGATINQITNKSLNSFFVPLPPTLAEQEAIAETLSDADALIESLETLLAKKRQVKQGAMSDLMSGKWRVVESGEWKVKLFGELASVRKQKIDPRKNSQPLFCIELEHIDQGTGRLIGSSETSQTSSIKSVFQKGDVLFGKLRAYLRKYWLADKDGVCSTEIWALIANPSLIIKEYLFQLVQMDGFIEAASMAYGTHMPRTDWNVVKNCEFSVPELPEQTAIAEILSDMDAEIHAVEEKLSKARAVKAGMMSALLGGRIRLNHD
jgi:type I restriction enzyme, S subunit